MVSQDDEEDDEDKGIVDTTPPIISINHQGEGRENDPGVWNVVIEDLESGLAEVQILIDGAVDRHYQDLAGISSMSYQVPVPASVGVHTLRVKATNTDHASSSKDNSVEIFPAPIDPGPPPVIIFG